jgi:hypothetical protein
MAGTSGTSQRLLSAGLIAAATLFSGCMSYSETAVYQLYKTNADRCSQNETDACVALLQTRCEAPVRLCTSYVPDFQAQANRQLTEKCRANEEASCQALATLACDNGDRSVCERLGARYSELYESCKAGNPADCDSISTLTWPKAQTDSAGDTCNRGDVIGCRVANASNNALNPNVGKDTQFPLF